MKSNIVNFDNIIKKVITNPEKYKKLGRGGQADVYLYIDNNDKYAIRIPKTKLTKHEIKILEKISFFIINRDHILKRKFIK